MHFVQHLWLDFGESDEHFEELCRFIKEIKFDKMGCFTYSAEEDTPAAEYDNQIDEEVKRDVPTF